MCLNKKEINERSIYHGGENNYNTVSSYGALCVKLIKDNQMCLNKKEINERKIYHGWENNYNTLSSYGSLCIKLIKDNQMCFNKQEINERSNEIWKMNVNMAELFHEFLLENFANHFHQ